MQRGRRGGRGGRGIALVDGNVQPSRRATAVRKVRSGGGRTNDLDRARHCCERERRRFRQGQDLVFV